MQPEIDKPVLVVSHERSGTHFLMNSLAAEFGYVSRPIVSFDHGGTELNFYHPASIRNYFRITRSQRPDVVRKSHHPFDFFAEVIEPVLEVMDIFYIHRDPRDVMHSYRHAMNDWDWFEGPKLAEAGAFIRAEPAGWMMRFQYRQYPNLLKRWQGHVEGWTDAARRFAPITVVKFEEMERDYDAVMDRIAAGRGWTRRHGPKPTIDRDTILKSRRESAGNVYSAEDVAFFRDQIGATMERLGYEI